MTAAVSRQDELRKQIRTLHDELRALETASEDRENAKLVGKAFRYRNSYGGGEEWWLYALVVKAEGGLRGMTFQKASDGKISIEFDDYLACLPGDKWEEITLEAFGAYWKIMMTDLEEQSAKAIRQHQ